MGCQTVAVYTDSFTMRVVCVSDILICICTQHTCATVHVKVRVQLVGICSHAPCDSQGMNSGGQAWLPASTQLLIMSLVQNKFLCIVASEPTEMGP